MSLRKRLAKQFKAEFVGRFIATTSGALLTILLARLLTPNKYGLLYLGISIFGVLWIFSKLGVAKSGARYITEYKEKDQTQIPGILRTSLLYNVVAICIVSATLLVFHSHLARWVGEPDLEPILLLGVLFLVFSTLTTYVRLSLQGLEAIELSAGLHSLTNVTRLVLSIGLVLLGYGALGALAGYILSFALVTGVGLWIIYSRFYTKYDEGQSIGSNLQRKIGEYAIPLTATNTANVLDKRVDTILVGVFLTPLAVSFYVVSKQFVMFLEMPASALGFTLSPMYGAESSGGNADQASKIYESALEYSLLIYIPAAAGVILVAEPAISLVFGNEYLGAIPVLKVLAVYAVLRAVALNTSNALDFLGRARARATVQGITSVLNFGLNIVLIPKIGVVGAAAATVISYSLYTFANVYIIHMEFDLRVMYLCKRIGQIIGISAVMSAGVWISLGIISGWITFFSVVSIGVAIWGILAFTFGLLDQEFIKSAFI